MDRTQQIKEAHPWLSYDEVVKVLLYHHQDSMWIQNLERDRLERSMEAFTKLLKSKSMKALKPFVDYVQDIQYSGVDKYGNQIEVSKESFEKRWNKARAILERDKKIQLQPITGTTIYRFKLTTNNNVKRKQLVGPLLAVTYKKS